MKQAPFEAAHAREWGEFEAFLEKKPSFDPAELPARFRRVCQSLALAAERHYSTALVDRLNRLALRGHHALYVNRRRESQQVLGFILAGFPRLVRQEWRLVAAAALLFFGPLLGLVVTGMEIGMGGQRAAPERRLDAKVIRRGGDAQNLVEIAHSSSPLTRLPKRPYLYAKLYPAH
jgi:hypothetical protein